MPAANYLIINLRPGYFINSKFHYYWAVVGNAWKYVRKVW